MAKSSDVEAQGTPSPDGIFTADQIRGRVMSSRRAEMGIPPRYSGSTLDAIEGGCGAESRMLGEVRGIVRGLGEESGAAGMILIGNPGTGKTTVACACLESLARAGRFGLYATTSGLMRKVKETWDAPHTPPERVIIGNLASLPLLVIDDVGVQFGSDAEKVLLTEILNLRYGNLKPTILVANATLPELTEILGERVIDRFRDGGRVFVFDWPSHRGSTK